MTTYRQNDKDKDFIDTMERMDITDYVQTFLMGFKKKHDITLKFNYLDGAEHLKKLINSSENKVCPYSETLNGFLYLSPQKVDFVPSNLGYKKGYIFYFICIYCEQRVKYLYKYRTYELAYCRKCCKLGYIPPSRKTRNIPRLLRNLYISKEEKQALIKHAGITKEDILELESQNKN